MDNSRIIPVTPIKPQDFFLDRTLSLLQNNLCGYCGINKYANLYCLVGRHIELSQTEKFNVLKAEMKTTTKYAYQGCYIPICRKCYEQYKLHEKIVWGLYLLFLIPFIGGLIFLVLSKLF